MAIRCPRDDNYIVHVTCKLYRKAETRLQDRRGFSHHFTARFTRISQRMCATVPKVNSDNSFTGQTVLWTRERSLSLDGLCLARKSRQPPLCNLSRPVTKFFAGGSRIIIHNLEFLSADWAVVILNQCARGWKEVRSGLVDRKSGGSEDIYCTGRKAMAAWTVVYTMSIYHTDGQHNTYR